MRWQDHLSFELCFLLRLKESEARKLNRPNLEVSH